MPGPLVSAPLTQPLAQLVLWLVEGHSPDHITARAITELSLTPDSASALLARARHLILAAAGAVHDAELTTALDRLEDCYTQSFHIESLADALRERRLVVLAKARMLGILDTHADAEPPDEHHEEQLRMVRAHLAPLVAPNPDDPLPLPELARLAACEIMRLRQTQENGS